MLLNTETVRIARKRNKYLFLAFKLNPRYINIVKKKR